MQERLNKELDFQPYNSDRPDLVIPEYGRNIQRMIEYALTLEDREERNKCTRAILSVMGQLVPHLRDIEDYNHKLWDHLHIISGFQLEVDSPYPKPDPQNLVSKPQTVPYPHNDIKVVHYGHYVEEFIDKCSQLEEGPEKEAFSLAIANLMKYNAHNWNRNTVYDDVIRKDLVNLSKGKIKLADETGLKEIKDNGPKFKEYEPDTFKKKKKKKKKFKPMNKGKY
ncbi:MAG: DUF4290 domain-containing protein [Flavobacteriales bacterium]